jgi:hypothetical protein
LPEPADPDAVSLGVPEVVEVVEELPPEPPHALNAKTVKKIGIDDFISPSWIYH